MRKGCELWKYIRQHRITRPLGLTEIVVSSSEGLAQMLWRWQSPSTSGGITRPQSSPSGGSASSNVNYLLVWGGLGNTKFNQT